jgi:hypothetical protein
LGGDFSADEAVASFSLSTSFSRAAWLSAGLKVTFPGLPRMPGDPDLLNKSEGSTFLSRINFFTLCLPPLPNAGLALRPRKFSGASMLVIEKEPDFPLVKDRFCPGTPSMDDDTDAPNPRSFELAGV